MAGLRVPMRVGTLTCEKTLIEVLISSHREAFLFYFPLLLSHVHEDIRVSNARWSGLLEHGVPQLGLLGNVFTYTG